MSSSSSASERPSTPPISVLTRALVAEIRATFESDDQDSGATTSLSQHQQTPIELCLAHHAIERLENLDLLALSGLDVAGNRLRQLHGLEAQPALRELNVADNLMCVIISSFGEPPAAMDSVVISFAVCSVISSLDCPVRVSSRRFPSCPRCTHSTYRATASRPRRTPTPCARGRASRVRRRCACFDWPAMRCAARIRTIVFGLLIILRNTFQSDCLIGIISGAAMFLTSQRVCSSLFARSSDTRMRRRCETLGFRRASFGGAFARIVGCIVNCHCQRYRFCECSGLDLVHIFIGIIVACESWQHCRPVVDSGRARCARRGSGRFGRISFSFGLFGTCTCTSATAAASARECTGGCRIGT